MKFFPIAKPTIGKEEERAVLRVLRSGVLSMGPKVDAFEKRFAKFAGTKYAAAVSSGTAGLHVSLIAAGVTEGDEVITSPFSFVASANTILYVGAKPVFADIDPMTYNINPDEIEAKITKKTKAILVVHIFGQSADMTSIVRIAKKYKLKIIEDACESLGATYKGNRVGTFGDAGVFAFYPNKQMTTGEGGMVVSDSKKHIELIKSLRNQGRAADMQWLDHERLGYNYRLDEMSATVGLVQLGKIDFFLRERNKIAKWYTDYLSPFASLVQVPEEKPEHGHTWFVYVVTIKKGSRDKIIQKLNTLGVSAKPYLPSIHLFNFYRKKFGYNKGNFPISEKVSKSAIALPFYVGLKKEDIQYITKTFIRILS